MDFKMAVELYKYLSAMFQWLGQEAKDRERKYNQKSGQQLPPHYETFKNHIAINYVEANYSFLKFLQNELDVLEGRFEWN